MGKVIDGISVGGNSKDLRGRVFGNLTVEKLYGRTKTGNLIWVCRCGCGNTTNVRAGHLGNNHTTSCGCLHKNFLGAITRTHGMTNSPEYKAWCRIKYRCLDSNSSDYEKYSKLGISDKFVNDFIAFYEDIGPIPKDFQGSPSVDRIDNNKGYFPDNIRWATQEQQSRNKGMNDNNTSGVTGVSRRRIGTPREEWVASWMEGKKRKTRTFTVEKYGHNLAFFAACEARDLAITRLNMQGYGYTKNHGK